MNGLTLKEHLLGRTWNISAGGVHACGKVEASALGDDWISIVPETANRLGWSVRLESIDAIEGPLESP